MPLEKAAIVNLNSGERMAVMFNPEEYSLEQGNSFAEVGVPGLRASPIQYVRGNLRVLKMELFFDTYEQRTDVRGRVREITSLLEKDSRTQAPPILLFSWGGFNFQCVLESASQRFVMFIETGMPVRAHVNVTFKEYAPIEIQVERGLFLGPPAVQTIVEGDTVSKIAGTALGDPSAWREIAQLNDIDNPFKLAAGQRLLVPPPKPRKP